MVWLGGGLALTAAGTLHVDGADATVSANLTSAFAINAIVDYPLNELVALRAMPRYIMNIGPPGETSPASALDVRVGGTLGKQVVPQLRLYGVGAVGGAILQGSNPSNDRNSAFGVTLSFGAGAAYSINPTLRLYVEAVYELGFYKDHGDDIQLNWLELSAGLQFGQ